jgi:hypothetical protein
MGLSTLLFLIPVLLIGAFGIYQIKTKGFKGATFGAKILDTSPEIKLSNGSGFNGHIKVHTLEKKGKKNIGIEVIQKTPLSYDMTALNFQREDIFELVSALTVALENTEPDASGQRR